MPCHWEKLDYSEYIYYISQHELCIAWFRQWIALVVLFFMIWAGTELKSWTDWTHSCTRNNLFAKKNSIIFWIFVICWAKLSHLLPASSVFMFARPTQSCIIRVQGMNFYSLRLKLESLLLGHALKLRQLDCITVVAHHVHFHFCTCKFVVCRMFRCTTTVFRVQGNLWEPSHR